MPAYQPPPKVAPITRSVAVEGRLVESVPESEFLVTATIHLVSTPVPWDANKHTVLYNVITSFGIVKNTSQRNNLTELSIDIQMGWAYATGHAMLTPLRPKGAPWQPSMGIDWELQLNRDDPAGPWSCRLVHYWDNNEQILVLRSTDATAFNVTDTTPPAP